MEDYQLIIIVVGYAITGMSGFLWLMICLSNVSKGRRFFDMNGGEASYGDDW